MRRRLSLFAVALALTLPATCHGQAAADTSLQLGQKATPEELAKFFSIPANGAGLPAGRGSVADGRTVFEAKCAMCHGEKLEGVKATGGLPLVGGRGSLTQAKPMKTTESYWPYATTLFDYIKRAMPVTQPGSLSDDEVYALCAYILARGQVVPEDTVLDKVSLPKIAMPNRKGFLPFAGPNLSLSH